MSATVIVNNLTVVHRRSGGTSVAAPDVCKTPTPAGPPAPIAYVNTALSRSTAKGSRSVRIDGTSIMLASSQFSTSAGDEPGALGGLFSGKFKGKAYPKLHSLDVQVEGKGVFRLTDIMLQNSGSPPNTPAGIVTQPNKLASALEPDRVEVVKMQWAPTEIACGDPVHLAMETQGAQDGEALTVAVVRTDRTSFAAMDQFAAPLKGNRARQRWISRRTKGFAVKVPAVAVQRTMRGVERSGNALMFRTVADQKSGLVKRVQEGHEFEATGRPGIYRPTGNKFTWEVCYQMEIRQGCVYVQRRIDFNNYTGAPITDRMWRDWQREIHGVWDNRVVLHRTQCKRGKGCDCSALGCCKFPLRIVAERGPGHGKVDLFPGGPLAVNRGKRDLWWYSHTWWTERGEAGSPCVRAHEFGHLIGCYDEYLEGAGNPSGKNVDAPRTVMGRGTIVRVQHVQEFIRWFNDRAHPPFGKTRPIWIR